MRPRIHRAVLRSPRSGAADHAVAAPCGHFQPHLVRVRGAFREQMPQRQRAQHDVEDVLAPGFEHRQGRAQRGGHRRVDVRAGVDGEDVHAKRPFQHPPVRVVDFGRKPQQVAKRRVRRWKAVVVDAERAGRVEAPRREIVRGQQRHVAAVAVRLRFVRVVEARHAMPGHAAQQERIVVVLAAQPAVLVERFRQVDLVAGAAELGLPMQRLQERTLVQRRLRLDEHAVDPAQRRMLGGGERIALRDADHVVGVAAPTDRFDGVASHAADAGVGAGVVLVVELGVVEAAAEERRRVVAASAEPRRFHVAIACQQHLPGLADGERIGRIVEGGETVGAVLPAGMGVRVAAGALVVAHQFVRGNQPPIGGAGERRAEVHCNLGAAFPSRFDQPKTSRAQGHRHHGDGAAHPPADGPSGEPMQHEQPSDHERRRHVQPVRDRAHGRIAQFHHRQPAGQRDAGGQQRDHGREQAQPQAHRQPVGAVQGAAQMHDAVHQRRQDDGEAERQMGEEHGLVEGVLQPDAAEPLPPGHRPQIGGVDHQQREQHEHRQQQLAHPRPDHGRQATGSVFALGRHRGGPTWA